MNELLEQMGRFELFRSSLRDRPDRMTCQSLPVHDGRSPELQAAHWETATSHREESEENSLDDYMMEDAENEEEELRANGLADVPPPRTQRRGVGAAGSTPTAEEAASTGLSLEADLSESSQAGDSQTSPSSEADSSVSSQARDLQTSPSSEADSSERSQARVSQTLTMCAYLTMSDVLALRTASIRHSLTYAA